MKDFQNILAVLQHNAHAPRLLRKLKQLSRTEACDISIIRVVYESLADLPSKHVDVTPEYKTLVLNTAQKELRDAIEEADVNASNITSAAMWHPHLWQGILDAAESTGADLIVKTIKSDPQFSLRTPDDWNLLRHAEIPVLLTQPRAWMSQPTIVVALDVYDEEHEGLNIRILHAAQHLAHQLKAELHLVSIFPVLSRWLDGISSMQSYVQMRKGIEEEIFIELADYAERAGIRDYQPHAVEGDEIEAMGNLTELLHADIAVLGTKARKGVKGALLGNTAEQLLHTLTCDVLTVP